MIPARQTEQFEVRAVEKTGFGRDWPPACPIWEAELRSDAPAGRPRLPRVAPRREGFRARPQYGGRRALSNLPNVESSRRAGGDRLKTSGFSNLFFRCSAVPDP